MLALKRLTREPEPSTKPELVELAKQLDREIQHDLKSMDMVTIHTMTRVAERLTRMRDEQLWKYLGFRRFPDYVKHVHSKLAKSRSKLFNLLATHALTTGENPIAPDVVEQMGQKKAVELSRLAPHQRTPEIVRTAIEQPLSKVRNAVQGILGKMLGKDLDRNGAIEACVPGAIHLPHAARTQRRLDFIGTEFRARGQSHECAQL